MRMSEGVEWAAHVCVLLDWLNQGELTPVPAGRLAEAYDLPAAYLGKQLQALTRAGITESVPGRYGGVRLARPAASVTLMDVVAAIEGPEDAFSCTEIRQQGMNSGNPPRDFAQPCGIAHAMRSAELAWRRELAETSIADLVAATPTRVADGARHYFQRA
ncbi:Rrf2 family transcriptional regulator [Tsukamurella sp. 8F]|uniref:RrF2 family transcriptional regulator n=1 Tax=Tsukamurella sp. 8F TaxID=3031961 RepID=UPI0023B8F95F|nr:Rrf2 family transcriptional regulator [Tsukamurella sp. 8F]MDF0586090.1 Rrf2 family transcriptional regulator [Tsukamurella sp. 8F]